MQLILPHNAAGLCTRNAQPVPRAVVLVGSARFKRGPVLVRAEAAEAPPAEAPPAAAKKRPPPAAAKKAAAAEGGAKDAEEAHWQQALKELEKARDDPTRKLCVAQVAPAVRVAISEAFGLGPGALPVKKLVTAMRMIGFDYVFDTNFSADLTIMEEGHELLARLQGLIESGKKEEENMPMFTSCCPGWVAMIEKSYPEVIPYLSTSKSPQMMMGAVIKNYFAKLHEKQPGEISMISVMPCVRKQGEADRPWFDTTGTGARDVDHVITTAEMAKIIKDKGIDLAALQDSEFDDPLGLGSGGGQLFGTTGGVMEAALRTVYEVVSGQPMGRINFEEVRGMDGLKEATINIKPADNSPYKKYDPEGKGLEVKVAVANGLGNAKKIITNLKAGTAKYDFVEVMACPGGCIGGGGQPRSTDKEILKKRQQAMYDLDERLKVRRPHDNVFIQKLYAEFLGVPNGEKAHHLLHTHYVPGGPAGSEE